MRSNIGNFNLQSDCCSFLSNLERSHLRNQYFVIRGGLFLQFSLFFIMKKGFANIRIQKNIFWGEMTPQCRISFLALFNGMLSAIPANNIIISTVANPSNKNRSAKQTPPVATINMILANRITATLHIIQAFCNNIVSANKKRNNSSIQINAFLETLGNARIWRIGNDNINLKFKVKEIFTKCLFTPTITTIGKINRISRIISTTTIKRL